MCERYYMDSKSLLAERIEMPKLYYGYNDKSGNRCYSNYS